MTESDIRKYCKKIASRMTVSVIIWFIIITYQLIVGIFTLWYGYGLATLLLMIYNIIGCIKYIKNINAIKKMHTKMELKEFVSYFENLIPICWTFLFINLVLGGILGALGNLSDLLIAYKVKKDKDMLLNTNAAPNVEENYREL